MNISFQSAQFILTPQDLATSSSLFLLRVTYSSGKCSLTFVGPKVWSSIPNDIKPWTTFTFKWKLKKHFLHDKDTQLWTFATFHLFRTKFCVFYVYLLFAFFLPCAHPIVFRMKFQHESTLNSFCLFFSSVPH